MLLKSYDAPDGPLHGITHAWHRRRCQHPCWNMRLATRQACKLGCPLRPVGRWIGPSSDGWHSWILIKERQAQKRITSRWVRRSVRLAARAGEFEEAFTDIRAQRCEEVFKQQERTHALECGQTLLLDSSATNSTFAEGLAERSYMTMAARMDVQLDESCAWMHWKQHRAIFAIRTWGGVVWRWLSTCVCEIISCGSSGLAGGSQMVSQTFAAVTSEGAKVVVLKSLAGGEKFWQEQGFQRFQPTMAWFRNCTNDVKEVLLSYRKKLAGLPTYVKHFDFCQCDRVDGLGSRNQAARHWAGCSRFTQHAAD